jgi:hypothetical protein
MGVGTAPRKTAGRASVTSSACARTSVVRRNGRIEKGGKRVYSLTCGVHVERGYDFSQSAAIQLSYLL